MTGGMFLNIAVEVSYALNGLFENVGNTKEKEA